MSGERNSIHDHPANDPHHVQSRQIDDGEGGTNRLGSMERRRKEIWAAALDLLPFGHEIFLGHIRRKQVGPV